MNRRTWLTSWLKPSNIIALGILLIGAFTAFQSIKNSNNTPPTKTQTVTATEECNVDTVGQKANGTNVEQKVDCSGESEIKNINQE